MIEFRPCKRCGIDTRQEVSRSIFENGGEHYGWWCLSCKGWSAKKGGGIWIPIEKLAGFGVDLAAVPTVEVATSARCTRCGRRGAELHHWAPQALFTDADKWPQDYLCVDCHQLWHRIVTPQLTRKQA